MPSFAGVIGEDDLVKLVAYIQSLGAEHARMSAASSTAPHVRQVQPSYLDDGVHAAKLAADDRPQADRASSTWSRSRSSSSSAAPRRR